MFYDGRWDGLDDNDDDARLWSWSRSPIAFYCLEALSSAARLAMPVASGQPTSANSPDGLAAAYQVGPISAASVDRNADRRAEGARDNHRHGS
jgi:hypothetical protein